MDSSPALPLPLYQDRICAGGLAAVAWMPPPIVFAALKWGRWAWLAKGPTAGMEGGD